MTETEILRIDLALELSNGNRVYAASILEMPPQLLKEHIRNTAFLRDKWQRDQAATHTVCAPTEAPTVIDTLALKAPVPAPQISPVSPDEQQLAVISAREDAALRKGLGTLGLSAVESEEVVSLAAFHRQHSARSVDIFGATLVKRGVRLSILLAKLEEDLKTGKNLRDIWSPDGTMLIKSGEESKFDLYYRGLAELRKMHDLAITGGLARAKMKMWEKNGKVGGKERKPGFSPLKRPVPAVAIQVQSGGSVTLNEKQNHGSPPQD